MRLRIINLVTIGLLLVCGGLALAAHMQLNAITTGAYDPVKDDGKSVAQAEAQVVRLQRIRAAFAGATAVVAHCLWRQGKRAGDGPPLGRV